MTILSEFLFDSVIEKSLDSSDLLESENENEQESKDPNPVEEEIEQQTPNNINQYYSKKEKSLIYNYQHAKWENYSPPIPTEPPELAV